MEQQSKVWCEPRGPTRVESCNDTQSNTSDSHSENIITIHRTPHCPQRAADRLNITSRAVHAGTCWEIYDYTHAAVKAECVLQFGACFRPVTVRNLCVWRLSRTCPRKRKEEISNPTPTAAPHSSLAPHSHKYPHNSWKTTMCLSDTHTLWMNVTFNMKQHYSVWHAPFIHKYKYTFRLHHSTIKRSAESKEGRTQGTGVRNQYWMFVIFGLPGGPELKSKHDCVEEINARAQEHPCEQLVWKLEHKFSLSTTLPKIKAAYLVNINQKDK